MLSLSLLAMRYTHRGAIYQNPESAYYHPKSIDYSSHVADYSSQSIDYSSQSIDHSSHMADYSSKSIDYSSHMAYYSLHMAYYSSHMAYYSSHHRNIGQKSSRYLSHKIEKKLGYSTRLQNYQDKVRKWLVSGIAIAWKLKISPTFVHFTLQLT